MTRSWSRAGGLSRRRDANPHDGGHARADVGVDTAVALGPLVLPAPVVAASGTFGHGDEVARYGDVSRLGAVTVKSLAAFAWEGNPAPRLHPVPGGGLVNSVGLAGPGVEQWRVHELPALVARGARVIASLWGRSVEEFARAARMLAPSARDVVAVEVNVSCPNLDQRDRLFAHSPDATMQVVQAVRAALSDARLDSRLDPPRDAGRDASDVRGATSTVPVWVKLSPNTDAIVDVAAAARDAGADALTLVNTVVAFAVDVEARRPALGAGAGGLSGSPILPVALRAVRDVHRALPDAPIVGTGGVTRGEDAVAMLMAGASAVGVGTATFRDPRACWRVQEELVRWCAHHGVDTVAELTGVASDPGTGYEGHSPEAAPALREARRPRRG